MFIRFRFMMMIDLILLTMLLMLAKQGSSTSFNYSHFDQKTSDITRDGDAELRNSALELTKNQADRNINSSSGRASYDRPVQLWDPDTGQLTDFATHFTFLIKKLSNENVTGDGLTFFLAPFDSKFAKDSSGEYLGLFSHGSSVNSGLNSSSDQKFVAVEFDTFQNPKFDPSPEHVGIDINSIVSVTNKSWTNGSMKDGKVANAWTHSILSWSFNSTLEPPTPSPSSEPSTPRPSSEPPRPSSEPVSISVDNGKGINRLAIGLTMGFGVVICGLGVMWLVWWRKRPGREIEEEEEEYDPSIDREFERGTGPKRFTYHELRLATGDFAEEGKLGEGGFGGVYKGLLHEPNVEVAVKRISKASQQGQKEYVSEVKIISRLRHKNLVQLIGWCHKKGEFLLVYEYLPNGSLDFHLFGDRDTMPWTVRHKIALGLASALLYLHEEWEQCIVHRDIKSSNVMLDANFNAKLGDFGLARLVDHEYSLHTVALAGTMGYIAPECVETGKSSKESDVYSFGVVALEICCGRRPVVPSAEEPSKVKLVAWVWELYGKGQLLEAVDKRLRAEFDIKEMECLMIVGLWCCHPDPNFRPSIKQATNVLKFEAPLPMNLPKELPKPVYWVPPLNVSLESYSSSVSTGRSVASSTSTSESTSKPLSKIAE